MDGDLNSEKKLLAAKMLLDTYEIPKRPMAMSAHQYKKKFGTNQGYSSHKKNIKKERLEWDSIYKGDLKVFKTKLKYLSLIQLSDEMLLADEREAQYRSIEPQDVLSEWLQLGYQQGC